MSGKYIYAYRRLNRHGERLYGHLHKAIQDAMNDLEMNLAEPLSIKHVDGRVIYDGEDLLNGVFDEEVDE